jgi:RNA polymerase sigma-70 factor, ECF subfamily
VTQMTDFERPHSQEDALDAQVRAFLAARTLLQAHVRSLVRDAALAEDVFQEVWLRFEKATRHGELISNVPAWCRAAARLVALENWRKQARELPTPDPELADLIDQAHAEQDQHADHWHQHSQALTQCLDALPARSLQLITLRYRQALPIAEIATQLGQSLGSLKTSLCRLRLSLGECVRRRLALSTAS